MKNSKRAALCFVSALLIVVASFPVYAANEEKPPVAIAPAFTYINSTAAALTFSNNTITCSADISARTNVTSVKIFFRLHKYVSGTWTPCGEWTASSASNFLDMTREVSGTRGTYRMNVSFYANTENTIIEKSYTF